LVAAAKLVNASTLIYTDSDGDRVTVKVSEPLLTEANVNQVFKFDSGWWVAPRESDSNCNS
jgi:hypothetical protein